MADTNELRQQLAQVDQAYTNAKAAGSPDADQLASMAQSLARQISAATPPPSPAEPSTLSKVGHEVLNDVAAPIEAGAQMATGAIAQPASGIAGLGATAAHALGANVDPADVVQGVQHAMTYQPRTEGGKDTSALIGNLTSWMPEGADAAGQWVSDKTGSPALGAATTTGLQGGAMLLGGEAPAALRAVGAAAKKIPGVTPVANLISDYTPGGTERAARRNYSAAAGDAGARQAAMDAITTYQQAKAGMNGVRMPAALQKYQPTTAQIADNAGLAGLERTLRNQPPDTGIPTAFADRDALNRTNTNDILEGISGSATDRLRAQTARDLRAESLYEQAMNNPLTQHSVPTGDSVVPPTNSTLPVVDGTDLGLNEQGEKLNELMKRPAMQQALAKARELSANDGVQLNAQNAIQTLHYMKKAMDDKIAGTAETGLGPTEKRILLGAQQELLGVMDSISPEYQMARQTYRDDSVPINRMELGEYLRQKYLSALQDASGVGSRPSMFTQALRDEDTPSRATGFSGATWDNTLTPEDLTNLEGVGQHLGREHFAQNAGRGVGSNTGQNLAGQRALDTIGSTRGISEDLGHPGMVALALTHPAAAIPLATLGASVRRGAVAKMAEAGLNPDLALKYLKPTENTQIPVPVTATAAVGADENDNRRSFNDMVQAQN